MATAKKLKEASQPAPQDHEKYKASKAPQSKEEALEQLKEWAEERKNTPDGKTFVRAFTAYDSRVIALELKDFQQYREDEDAFDFDIFYDGMKHKLLGRFEKKNGEEEEYGITKKKCYNKCATLVAKVNAIMAGKYAEAQANGSPDSRLKEIQNSNWRTPLISECKYKRFSDSELRDILDL